MRLLIWCSTFSYGGGERLLSRLIEAFLNNVKITQLGLALPENVRQSFEEVVKKHDHFQLYSLPNSNLRQWTTFASMPRLRSTLYNRSRARRREQLQRAIDKWGSDFDVLYCFWAQSEPFIKSPIPVVATIQDLTAIEFPEILGEEVTAEIRRDTATWLLHASCVVSSVAMREKVLGLFPENKRDVRVIHHAASPVTNSHDIKLALPANLPERYLIYPANLNSHKNHYSLLIAFEQWARRSVIPLVLVGEGTELLHSKVGHQTNWQISRLRSLISRKHLRPGVDYFALGYVADSQLRKLIEGAWALVMPSLAEGGGSFPAEEALSLGVPIACSDIPVMREHLAMRSAKIAWFDAECPTSILAAFDDLWTRYPHFKESALRGRNDRRPTWEEIAAAYVEIFSEAPKEAPLKHD